MTTQIKGNNWNLAVWAGAIGLWVTPMIAMQFTKEVAWTASDFAIFGIMLLAVAGLYEVATRTSASLFYRAAAAIALGTSFLLVWVNLAVGLVGSEENPVNLLYASVLAVGAIGAALVRLKAQGMAWTVLAMAAAQLAVTVFVTVTEFATAQPRDFLLSAGFAMPWLVSAWLFNRADHQSAS